MSSTISLVSREVLNTNDEMRLTLVRVAELREQRKEYDKIMRDGFPYILTTSTGELLRGSTLALLPDDLAAAFSLAYSDQEASVTVLCHAGEAGAAAYKTAWAVFQKDHPGWDIVDERERDNGH